MERNSDYTLLYRIAKAYYSDKKTQQEIADVENFSRSQISRLLQKALDEEIVTYQVKVPSSIDEQALSQQLCQHLKIERVVLIPSFYQDHTKVSSDDVTKNLTLGASEKIPQLLGDCKNIGVGWGNAVYNTALYLPTIHDSIQRTFVPLIGLSGDNNPALQINTIVDRFGERFFAERNYINLQSLQKKSAITEGALEPARATMEKWMELDAAIIGIGCAPANAKTMISEFSPLYRKQVQTSGTVGDILSHFFYQDGRVFDMDQQYNLLAFDINKLTSVKNVIAIAAGWNKCIPIQVAARLGYIKTLVTDFDTARAILNNEHD